MQKRIGIGVKDSGSMVKDVTSPVKMKCDVGDEYWGRFVVHLDAFCWVRRDSYLPQGSQGLKAVTKVKGT
jgi:hypothetical protein